MGRVRLFSKSLRSWTWDLHLYLGLFISPFVLVFTVTTILFNHTWKPWDGGSEVQKMSASVEVAESLEGLEQARRVMRQLDVSGEITYINRSGNRLVIPVMKPGQEIVIQVDLEGQSAEVERRYTGFWDALFYLHKSPGPHLAGFRGNWVYTRLWGWLADATVCLLLFSSASGIYMWWVLKAERKIGLVLMGGGFLSFFLAVFALIG